MYRKNFTDTLLCLLLELLYQNPRQRNKAGRGGQKVAKLKNAASFDVRYRRE
jgi:hypothetical protein